MQTRTVYTALLATGALFSLLPTAPLAAQTTTPVTVANNSFEAPIQADGTASTGLNNWIVVGNLLGAFNAPLNERVLTLNPNDTQYLGTTAPGTSISNMDGSQIASFRSGVLQVTGGSASQIIPTGLLTIGTQYTLTVAVGNPRDAFFQGYSISILAGTTSLASISAASTETNPNVLDGTFQDRTLTFTLGDLAPIATVGGLTINLSVPDALNLTTGYGTDFDNVRLTATNVVPEPSTIASACVGLLGLVGVQYIRRRRGFSAPVRA